MFKGWCRLCSLCGRWRPPSVPDSPIRHRSDPSLSCPASPGRSRVVLTSVKGISLLCPCLHILCGSGQTQVLGCGKAVSATYLWVRKSCSPWPGAQKGQCHPGCWHTWSQGMLSPSASSSLFSLDGGHWAAEQQWQQPDGAAGSKLGHLTWRQE